MSSDHSMHLLHANRRKRHVAWKSHYGKSTETKIIGDAAQGEGFGAAVNGGLLCRNTSMAWGRRISCTSLARCFALLQCDMSHGAGASPTTSASSTGPIEGRCDQRGNDRQKRKLHPPGPGSAACWRRRSTWRPKS